MESISSIKKSVLIAILGVGFALGFFTSKVVEPEERRLTKSEINILWSVRQINRAWYQLYVETQLIPGKEPMKPTIFFNMETPPKE